MLRTNALPTLYLPRPLKSGDKHFTITECDKNRISSSKCKRIIQCVTTYVCCVPDCFHSTFGNDCQLFCLPANLNNTILPAWKQFSNNMKDSILNEDSRICSCHFIDENFDNGPMIYQSDIIDALGLTCQEKQQYLLKIVPASDGSWDVINDVSQTFDNYSRGSTPISAVHDGINNFKQNETAFNLLSGFKNYHVFENFVSVFDTDYSDVLIEHQESLSFEDQMLLTIIKLKSNLDFESLGSSYFNISLREAKGVFERCTAVIENVLCDGVLDSGGWEIQKCLWKELSECNSVFFTFEISLEDKDNSIKKAKSLMSVTPCGVISYVSSFYPESMSIEDIIRKSKVYNIAKIGDVFIIESNAVQVKDIKGSQLIFSTPISTKLVHSGIISHANKICSLLLEYNILKFLPSELNNLSLRIWRIVCAVYNFNIDDSGEIIQFYLKSQKLENGESVLEEIIQQKFIQLLPG